MKSFSPTVRSTAGWFVLSLLLIGGLDPSRMLAGTWKPLNRVAPGSVLMMRLLPDGTVLAMNHTDAQNDNSKVWYRLTPDTNGSYINGSWTTLNSAHDSRLFFSSQVLTNGNVFVAGGEYGSGTSTAELFNPLANNGAGSWTYINPPTSLMNPAVPSPILQQPTNGTFIPEGFIDSISQILPDGDVLVAPVGANGYGETMIYNPTANAWSNGPTTFSVYQDEASWVKLPDDSILTIDPYTNTTERFIPSSNKWVLDETVPVQMYDAAGGELGAALLLPNKKAFFLGATGHTALYTPSSSGGTNFGHWEQGPEIPNDPQGKTLAAQDAPAAMMINGKILCVVGHLETASGGSPSPLYFFEYDYSSGSTGSFASVNGPTNLTDNPNGSYATSMLDLPDGTVLYCHANNTEAYGAQLYDYSPDASQLAVGKPVINSITLNADASYHLVGNGLNGISEGAAYGDEVQMNSNYPLVRMTDSSGHVYYARTFNWSSTGVMTGSKSVSTEFLPPPDLPPGDYSLVAVANGIASDSVTFNGQVWVDFNYTVGPENGTFAEPFDTLAKGVSAVSSGGTIAIKPGSSGETLTISKPMTLTAVGGAASIGN